MKIGEKMQITTPLSEICVTEFGAVYQCDRRNRLLVQFGGSVEVLKVDTFFRLKKAVDQAFLEAVAATSKAPDLELIAVCGCEKCYVLTLTELYAFKELLAQARFVLELNSMLHTYLKPLPA